MEAQTPTPYESWVILELLGHRKLGGKVKEVSIFGTTFLQFEGFDEYEVCLITQYYSPSAVYSFTPVSKEVAIAFGSNNLPVPVHQWELPLPQLPATRPTSYAATVVDDSDDGDYDEEELYS